MVKDKVGLKGARQWNVSLFPSVLVTLLIGQWEGHLAYIQLGVGLFVVTI